MIIYLYIYIHIYLPSKLTIHVPEESIIIGPYFWLGAALPGEASLRPKMQLPQSFGPLNTFPGSQLGENESDIM